MRDGKSEGEMYRKWKREKEGVRAEEMERDRGREKTYMVQP